MSAEGNEVATLSQLKMWGDEKLSSGGSSVLYSSRYGSKSVTLSETAANYTALLVRVMFNGGQNQSVTSVVSNGERTSVEINNYQAYVNVSGTKVSLDTSYSLYITKVIGIK